MEKLLRCRDLGMDCDFEACGETPEEVLKTAIDHARAIHGLKDIPEKDRIRQRSPTLKKLFSLILGMGLNQCLWLWGVGRSGRHQPATHLPPQSHS